MLVARYQIRLKDPDGVQVALFDDWRSLQFQKKLNTPGFYTFIINGLDPRVSLFEPDGQVEIWRSIPGELGWYKEFEAHHEDYYLQLFSNGNWQFTSVGTGYIGLLARRGIEYTSDVAQAAKSGVAETVMKEYVNENAGAAATSPPREADGVTAGLTIEVDAGLGSTWSGQRSTKNLLETLQEIANSCDLDFDVVGTGAATYEFQTFDTQRGEDRTVTGLDPTTGLNAAGNVPVIFAPELGNVAEMSYSIRRKEESNAVFVWGAGTAAARAIEVREDAAAIGVSPIGRRESSRSGASQGSTTADLQALGDEWLARDAVKEEFTFKPKLNAQTLYGKHFNVGDRVTARLGTIIRSKRIVGVSITVSENNAGEDTTFEFSDIP